MSKRAPVEQPIKIRTATRGRPAHRAGVRPDTRESLMTAASLLMTDKDSVDISLSEIAEKTGQSAALVQYHFGNKEGLMLAMLERIFDRRLKQLEALRAMALPAEQKLRIHIHGLINTYVEAPYVNRLLHALIRDGTPETANWVNEYCCRPVAEFHRQVLEDGVREGTFLPVKLMTFHFMLAGACEHLFARRSIMALTFGEDVVTAEILQEYRELVTRTILRGIAVNPAPVAEV